MKYKITLNGRTYEVEVEHGEAILADEYDAMAPVAPFSAPVPTPAQQPAPQAAPPLPKPTVSEVKGEVVTSPLPGTVLSIEVEQGAEVKAGQILLIIEAMKMENEVVAPVDGVVVQVLAKSGATVNSGDPLVVLG
jgi:biotin carboxyl carrier protein